MTDVTRHYRPVDRHVLHEPLLEFRELCAASVPTSARYIVFDLDRTLHMARNMGEFMGWELGALHSYGADHLDRVEESRSTSRFLVAGNQPIASSRYLLRGARAWAYPGLYYLLWGRMASRYQGSRQLRHRFFGAEPFTAIQAMPTLAFMHELSGVSVDMAATLAQRLLRRFSGDQVFDHEDIAWLRARCPNARIILSSASPRPTVEAAAHALGIDDWECAEIEIHDDHYSAPFQRSPLFLRDHEPSRITPPSRYRLNAGRAKIRRLLARFPEMADPNNEVVGITDTWNGEDHCWADHFTRVVDINSTSPFPPLVVATSPLKEIHSAQVLTRNERKRRADGEPNYVDALRTQRLTLPSGGEHGAFALAGKLADLADEVESLAARQSKLRATHEDLIVRHKQERQTALADIEHAVGVYNNAASSDRRRHLSDLDRLVRANDQLLRRYAHSQREISKVSLALSHQLSSARATLDRDAQTGGATAHTLAIASA